MLTVKVCPAEAATPHMGKLVVSALVCEAVYMAHMRAAVGCTVG